MVCVLLPGNRGWGCPDNCGIGSHQPRTAMCGAWRCLPWGFQGSVRTDGCKSCCIWFHKAERCIDSERAHWPIRQPSQIVVPAFPLGAPPSVQLSTSPLAMSSTSPHSSNKLLSRSMACMIMPRRRASATRAFLGLRRLPTFMVQLLSAKWTAPGLPEA